MGILEYFGNNLRQKDEIYYYPTGAGGSPEHMAGQLLALIREEEQEGKKGVVFFCIGTDRSTGDSLGPLVGHKLKEQERLRQRRFPAPVFGTLERPIHAVNLEQYGAFVRKNFPDKVLVAVDASVGSREHVGLVTLGRGPLKPGLGVEKNLSEIGDIFITGIVGGCLNFDPSSLASIRLSLVMGMADYIAEGIRLVETFRSSPSLL